MDATTLRWIIGIVGAVIIAAIFLFGNPDKKRKPRASRKRADAERVQRQEPTLESVAARAAEDRRDTVTRVDETGQGQLNIDPVEEAQAEPPPEAARPYTPPKPKKPAGPPPEKIVSLLLLASDNRKITGAELLEATVKTGMEFGDMDIFHRIPEGAEGPVFSLANAEKPGHFDREAWNRFETTGVTLFMTLPGPVFALDGWDAMLATARRMAEILHADLQDTDRHHFTRQSEALVREEMRDYDRNKASSG